MAKFIVKRLLLFVPTLFVISIVVFALIQAPPGDYLTILITNMQESGQLVDEALVASLEQRYGLDQPLVTQYFRWIGNIVFRGDFGVSFQWNRPVAELIWDRLLWTFVISFSTLLFTWIVAFPIGVFSATHQYSVLDYLATFFGFIGLAIPNFMIALVLMWIGYSWFGFSMGGLFSEEFVRAPWSFAKFIDLLQHVWVPIVVLGTAGTAGLIRTMRANLLDELRKPYVTTARAKGLSEGRLIWKYPVRVALNPFVSSVGYVLPQLISGATIVSVVLSLPTAGPMLLRSLLSQDMYLAGGFVLLLSALTVIGTLISDILLVLIDPRIRYE
jgi:peptide/nickel transport system permease protein